MPREFIEIKIGDVLRAADDFSAALLTVWYCQRQTEALSKKWGLLDTWSADAQGKSTEIAEQSLQAWDALRRTGRILYHVAIQEGASDQFVMPLAAGLQANLLTKSLYQKLEATAKSIKTRVFLQKEHPPQPSPKATKKEANIKARAYLKKHPRATVRELSREIECSTGLASKLPAWQAVQEQRKKGRKPKPVVVSLTAKLERVVGAQDDALARLIDEQKDDAEPSPLDEDRAVDRQGAPRRAKVYRKP